LTDEKRHEGLPVAGCEPQDAGRIATVNANKVEEELLLRRIETLEEMGVYDRRWLAISRTHIEQAFMAMNRAIFQPSRLKLPDDEG